MPITLADVRETLRADAVSLGLGALLVLASLLATVVASVVRRRMAPTLTLAVFAFLYGLRLLARTDIFRVGVGLSAAFWEYLAAAITYSIMVPAVLVARAMMPAWRGVWNWIVGGLVVFALSAIASDAILRQPNSARTLNNLIAIVFILVLVWMFFRPKLPRSPELGMLRLGIGTVSLAALADNLRGMGALPFRGPELEPFGFTVMIVCLGTIVGQRIIGDARRLVALDRELSIAREIQYSILPQTMPRLPGVTVAARYRPMTSVAGDFYDFLQLDEERVGVLVADVSGHGVPAALIASMVKVALAAQQSCADRPADVLAGMNRALVGRLASRYVTAAYLFIDRRQGTLRYAAAGHPPMLHLGKRGNVQQIEENGVLLGFLEDACYTTCEKRFEPGDRLLLYTDGLIEAENAAGDFYGLERVQTTIAGSSHLAAADAADAVLQAMDSWSQLPAADDLTIVLIERTADSPSP